MHKYGIILGTCMALLACCSCNNDLVEYKSNDLKITLQKGESWLHDFPLFLGISRKNPPQIAIWLEDKDEIICRPFMLRIRLRLKAG